MSGRPRTRGDLPAACSRSHRPPGSSPHARGSSRVRRSRALPERVVPARAGIFPEQVVVHRLQLGRPRTRGDLPQTEIWIGSYQASSPHARGSSLARGHRCQVVLVVPARAAIFPPSGPAARAGRCRPRTRGDLPAAVDTAGLIRASSPHARGSSRLREDARRRPLVVPARAGIFPSQTTGSGRNTSRPRTRGDLPTVYLRAYVYIASSPHARGSSRRRLPIAGKWKVHSEMEDRQGNLWRAPEAHHRTASLVTLSVHLVTVNGSCLKVKSQLTT